jgi:hypothetical protein
VKAVETEGLSGQGVRGPRSMARHGQIASVAKPIPVATMCRVVVPPYPGSGDRATAIALAPPSTRAMRPAGRTRLRPAAVTK